MWAGLKTLTDYKKKVMSASLPDELNTFYARFESTSSTCGGAKGSGGPLPTCDNQGRHVCRTLKRINTRKAPGPDGIPSRALKKPKILCLNDYRPVALTSTIMKCFERLVKPFITSSLPDSLDPLQFACRPNRSTEDAIALTLHTAPSHLDQRDTYAYVRMLFIDYSSAFNTIVPSKLSSPSSETSGSTAPCLQHHHQIWLTTTTVIGLITGDDETAYREEVRALTSWCQDNNLQLNVSKTKELIVDFRRRQREEHALPISINGTTVERVNSFRFLGVHISEDLTWTHHTDFITKCTIERILTGCITAWYSSCTSALNRKALQRVVKAAQHITRMELPSMEDLYTQRCRRKATKIIKDPSHPATDCSACCRLALT
ncbi:hypothetical protein L3Q82_021368, partial [Scortum barcoo]